ncbi:unnamed protein product [Vitrella brassicaformis CCMP3155]|uniref:PUB domain-containing protein n=2 Tax=Vitrella brassicaformis TaxID=1169539 RepID=A0A0G4G5Z1_VITBC|nr:unnamed protein product [Vitrella brassicaformis CCMP3155]|eukprot:CEM23950.1 unnamed protein product [Vitrella brassicaformis CCMP3155]
MAERISHLEDDPLGETKGKGSEGRRECRGQSAMEELTETIAHLELPDAVKAEAYALLLKLLRNIVSNPSEAKYRTIKRTNATIKAKLFLDGAPEGILFEDVIRHCGFNEVGETFVYPMSAAASALEPFCDTFEGILVSLNHEPQQQSQQQPQVSVERPKFQNIVPAQKTLRAQAELKSHNEQMAQIRAEKRKQFEGPASPGSMSPKASGTLAPPPDNVGPRSESSNSISGKSDSSAPSKGGKTAFDFKKRIDTAEAIKKSNDELSALRAQQRARFSNFQNDPNRYDAPQYQQPPSSIPPQSGNASGSSGISKFFNTLFGGGSSSSGGGGGGGGGSGKKPGPGGGAGAVKTIQDLPKPPPPRGG